MKNDARQYPYMMVMVCAFASTALAINSHAATATGTASATVIEPISVGFDNFFDPATFAGSLSTSGPLLRFGSTPPAGTVTLVIGPGPAGGAPSHAKRAKVVVTKNADGTVSIRMTGGAVLTFAVTQSSDSAVTIEYN